MKNKTISSIISFVIALTFLAGLIWTPVPAQAAAPELKAAGLGLAKSVPVTPRQDTGSGDPAGPPASAQPEGVDPASGEPVEPAPASPTSPEPAVEGTLSVAAATAACTPLQRKIMPLGDSITRGSGDGNFNGYRKTLLDALVSKGYNVRFVGSANDGTIASPNDQHEGHSGYHAWTDILDPGEGIYKSIYHHVYDWLGEYPADVVLLHIGTNDVMDGGEDAGEVDAILDEIDDRSTNTAVVLARIINLDPYSSAASQYNEDLEDMANSRIASGDKITVVDMENALSYPGDIPDGVHPNVTGYTKMAAVWEKALYLLLPICASNDTGTAAEDTLLTLSSLLNNDAGGDLRITAASAARPGSSVTIVNNGKDLQYLPPEDYNGSGANADTITYTVKAGDPAYPNRPSATATVTVAITPVNDPPVPVDDLRSVAEDTPLTFPASDLTLNDAPGPADEAGQALNVTAVASTPNTHGTVSLLSGILTYTPEKDFAGTADFTYNVCDNDPDSRCSDGTVQVTVTPVNDAPVISAIPSQTTDEDTPVQVFFTVSDVDSPLDSLSLSAAGSTRGDLVPLASIVFGGSGANRKATLTPAANIYGATNITLTVTDGQGPPVPAAFTLTVVSVNDPPDVTNPGTLTFPEGANVLYQIRASDVESGANLTYEWDSGNQLPPGLSLDKYSGKISGRLASGSAGAYTIRILVKDSPSDGGVTKVQFPLIVKPPSTQQIFIPLVLDLISR